MQEVPKERSDAGPEPQGKATSPVRFAGLVFDLAACTLARESGEAIPLTRGEFRLLRLFVSRPGRVVSRDAILDAVANRPLELFDRSADALVGRLRRKIEPDPKAPRLIVTVPGEGYRFDGLAPALRGAPANSAAEPPVPAEPPAVGPVPEAAQAGEPAQPDTAPPPPSAASARSRSWRRPAAAAALVLALFAAGAYGWRSGLASRFMETATQGRLAAAPRLSIVVLPFENMSGDKEQDYFVDGITDDLTTDLSHLQDSFVISHGTALTYKGKPIDAKRIGRELDVRYLLEGSVRRLDEKVEINAQLVSTETGAQVWADRFAGDRSKLGELQVDVVSRLANSLGVELVKAEALRATRERPGNPDADDLAMQAQVKRDLPDSKATLNEAVTLAERALALDPQNTRALTVLASALLDLVTDELSDNPAGDVARAEKAIDAASALQAEKSSVHYMKGYLYMAKQQWGPSITEFEAVTALDPNNARAYADAGWDKMFVGHAEDGLADVETALRLSPRDSSRVPWWQFFMCGLQKDLAHYEQAIPWCEKAVAGLPHVYFPLAFLAAANALAGHDKEAKDAAAQLLKINPGFTVRSWASIHWSDDPTFNAGYQRFMEGLRKAGLPEGEAKKEDQLASAPRLSIVVLPFENAGGDKEQDYFADGITDDLTTDLSHLQDSFVISHGTAFAYKGTLIDAKEIGRELGVRYLMEGSVRRLGEKVDVNARLVSTETGAEVWADRFEGERSKLGELQVEFVSRLANSLGAELVKAEALRSTRERPGNPDAADLAMQAQVKWYPPESKATINEAVTLSERALALDPQSVRALTVLTDALLNRVTDQLSDDPAVDIARAEKAIDAALALQPENSSVHTAKAYVYFAKRQWGPSITEEETAIALDPNNARAHANAGFFKAFLGHAEDGFAGVETALRLSPRDPLVPWWQCYMCILHTKLAHYEQAIPWCNKGAAGLPQVSYPYVFLAAANALAGHDKEAKEAAAQLQKVYPGFTVQTWAGMHWSDDPTYKAQEQRIIEGLRKAGVPEGEAKKAN